MARNGYKVTVYLDDNPNSPTYMETYEERTEDLTTCPISEDDLILVSNECEVVMSGFTGYRLMIYYNKTTGEYSEVRELDPECEASSSEEQWVASGDPFCEVTEQGVNTGYMLQLVVQKNQALPNYGETKYNRYKSPECGSNACPIWDDIQKSCHISVINCVATFDGTSDINQIDINPLSETYNQTRTVNKQDNDCENCTNTTFSWVLVGDMCGDDDTLCAEGLQQVSTNSYTVSRKYKTIGSGSPIPMDEYQIVLKTEDDEYCGYIRPQYRWDKAPGYLCDYETYTKYEMYVKMVSYDSGATWSTKQPVETQRGDVIAYDSYDCGKPMYRWVATDDYICEDNGDDAKIRFYSGFINGEFTGLVSSVPCNESSILSNSEVSSLTKSDYVVFGDCISTISGTTGLTTHGVIKIGDYVESITANAFRGVNSGSSVNNERVWSLEIPRRVSDFAPFLHTYGNSGLNTMIMRCPPPSGTPSVSSTLLRQIIPGVWCNTGVGTLFVEDQYYEDYISNELWSQIQNFGNKIVPMDRDYIDYKAIVSYKSDFSEWNWYIPYESTFMSDTTSDSIKTGEGDCATRLMTKIKVLGNVKSIASRAFVSNKTYVYPLHLDEIELEEGVETIGSNAFLECYASSVKLPSTLTSIGASAFCYNSLSSVHIPSGVTSISDYAFASNREQNSSTSPKKITSITIDNGVQYIGQHAFENCGAETLVIPASVTTIGANAFSSNSYQSTYKSGSTKTLVFEGSPSIYDYAFGMHPDAEYILMKSYAPYLRATSLGDFTCPLLVPGSSHSQLVYSGNTYWQYYGVNGKVIPNGDTFPTVSSYDLNDQWRTSTNYGSFSGLTNCSSYYMFFESNSNYEYNVTGDSTMSFTFSLNNASDTSINKSMDFFVMNDHSYSCSENTYIDLSITMDGWTTTNRIDCESSNRKWCSWGFSSTHMSATTQITITFHKGVRGTTRAYLAIPIVQNIT